MFNKSLSDENALLLLSEIAKVDNKAFDLIVKWKDSSDYGDRDMLLNQIHYFIKEHGNE